MTGHTTRDNVLLVLTDQERYDLTSPEGPPVETAALDGLAADGVRFTHAFTPISICSSARASILTSLYPHEHGILNNVHDPDAIQTDLPKSLPTFGELLQSAGYENTYVGKWHVGRHDTPKDFGFEYLGGSDQHHDQHLETNFRDYQRQHGVDPDDVDVEDPLYAHPDADEKLLAGRSSIPVEASRPYYIAEKTIERIEAMADGDGPFFHRTDFLGPHHPYVIPEPYASMYDPADLDPWPTYRETFAGKPTVQSNYLRYRGVESFDWDDWAHAISLYLGFMHLIDDQIARILDALDEHGLREDTLVVHASDHGDFAGNHRQFNKGPFMYDDTYRVPLVVEGPGVADGGRECDELVSLLDLMPTFLELADADRPSGMQGQSLWPLLENAPESTRDVESTVGAESTVDAESSGDAESTAGAESSGGPAWKREAVFAEYHGDELGLYSQRMVRTHRYKYVFNSPDVDELYDLEADPHELDNVVDHPHYRSIRDRLRQLLDDWMDDTGDPIGEWTSRHLHSS